ncbi:hypothetical protein [Lapidilactobacillus wuchangensis]|uniref:hypothetical protein n=1 Tax=Lapidilactobacillus wuchangensis TaxID=2486001 RepID=UPI000F7B5AA9|nr:hypothetical protein [Lapidilactobacillus wuchangensis]
MNKDVINTRDLYNLWEVQWCLSKGDLLAPWLRTKIPIHRKSEVIKDFYALINYEVDNPEGIKALVIAPNEVFFSTKSTRELMQLRINSHIIDVFFDRQLRDFLEVPNNRELSSCFGNSVMMHLSGVSSSKCADWVALHHIAEIIPVIDGSERYFVFCQQFALRLPVQSNFSQRLVDVTKMSSRSIFALHCIGEQLNLKLTIKRSNPSILQRADTQYAYLQASVTEAEIIRFRQAIERVIVAQVCTHPELTESMAVFDNSIDFFQKSMQRQHKLN